MLKKIYQELVLIYEELQAIRSGLEFEKFTTEDNAQKHFEMKASKTFYPNSGVVSDSDLKGEAGEIGVI